MAGKYYQNKEDRRHEARGMKRSYEKDSMDSGYMGMISEDHSAVANLPQEKMLKMYPKERYMDGTYLDDTIKGVDDNRRANIDMVDSHQSDSMY